RYDLSSSSYRSYSRFIPFRCYDVPYSNSGDSRRSIALFTSEWDYWTDVVGVANRMVQNWVLEDMALKVVQWS
ncbi:unnamed protein product, partial [Brassica napus]